MQYPKKQISGVILAGGKGRRLGGFDKGLLNKDGLPFVAHIQRVLSPQVGHLYINANRNCEKYKQYGTVIQDLLTDYQGPLAGMQTAIQNCQSKWIVTVPCDGINLSVDLVARLYKSLNEAGAQIAVAYDGQRLQPVHALIDCSLLSSLNDYLADGGRKIDHWYSNHTTVKTDFSDQLEMFRNVNTFGEKHDFGAQ